MTSDAFIIGCVGRMSKEKNQQFLLHVFEYILAVIPNSFLVLVGDGPERNNLEKLAASLKIQERVFFTGERTDIPAMLNAFDVFVMPSIFEGFPIAGIEAFSNGLPLVLSDTITKDLSFSTNVSFVSLDKRYEDWAHVICNFKGHRHIAEQADLVKDKGYDIESAANRLERLYLEF